jgi:predicted DsbA family dithiol-disulfide isomerase
MKLRTLLIMFLLAPALACAQTGQKPLAAVNGETLTEEQVMAAAARELETLETRRLQFEAEHSRNRHAAIEKALNGILEEKLLTAEAAKRGISKEELVAAEVERKAPPPTDQEISGFYEANRARINGSFDDVAPQIRAYLLDVKRDETFNAFMTALRKDYKVESFLEIPRAQIATEGYPSRGPQNAPVTIVEFSDFECPYCRNLYPTMKLIESNYADKVRVIYRQFPLTNIHPNAQKAAEASLCANDQQRFWELHDAMFEDQSSLTVDALKQKAVQLKLDEPAFNSCLDSGKHAEAVQKDVAEGVRLGITGTPTTFINGRYLNGALPYGDFVRIIEEEIQRSSVR